MHSPKSIIERNDKEALKQFYVAGADINAIYENGDTALIMACSYLNVDCVKLLLELGANTIIKNNSGYTAKKIAYWKGEYRNGSYTDEAKEIVNLIFNIQMKYRIVED